MNISGVDLSMPLMAATSGEQGSMQEAVGLKLLSSQLDLAEMQGAEMAKMMELSVMPSVGQNIDVSV